MQNIFPTIEKCRLFKDISPLDSEKLLSCLNAGIKTFEKGSIIFSEGAPARHAGILLSGKLNIINDDYYGNHNILADISPGELFGEVFACADTEFIPVTVAANEKSDILLFDCRRIISPCAENCEFHRILTGNLLAAVSEKALFLNRKLSFISKRTTREKLLSYLLYFSKQTGRTSFCIPFNRQELADFLCVDRSALSAEMSRMKRDRIIEYDRNRFTLL